MDQLNYHLQHPPRCLANFLVEPATLPGVVFDGHGEPTNAIFKLKCIGDASKFFVRGYHSRNPDFNNVSVFLSPIALHCASCGRVAELIDTEVHGHDGEQGASCTMHGDGERGYFSCPDCGPQPFIIFARFEYPDDLFDEECDLYRGRESDFFTWFSLRGVCANCDQLCDITDFECA